jgi:hypothetical protein
MALEFFKTKKLGDFDVIIMDELRVKYPEKFTETGAMDHKWFESDIRPKNFIYVRKDKNSIAFTLQSGPVKEVGLNGCQVDTLIEAAKYLIQDMSVLNNCRENSMAITKLDEALMWLEKIKKDRIQRNVEGTSKI